jgi:catechol 2,3-dioxygenase-like lactoylglutathione lyase family enzyme
MQVIDKLMMFIVAVSDMPKAKEFYADRLGLKVTKDYRQDDDHGGCRLLSLKAGFLSLSLRITKT